MKNKILLLITLVVFTINAKAQVKIGDNPGTINSNSLLEMESTNKGFLPPRVAINSLSSVSPLSGTVTAGMLVYSSGGTVTDGYYYWNGSAWISLATSTNIHNNYVLVKSQSDFPAAVSDVITLVSGTTYEINGAITMTNQIDLNGCTIVGMDNAADQLNYTGSLQLFTGTHGGTLNNILLSASTSGAKLFNINAGNASVNIIIMSCFIVYCNSVGILQNFGQSVYMRDNAFQHNTNGITFQNDTNVMLFNTLWDYTNSNTYHTFIGKFANIEMLGGAWQGLSANSATSLSISGITSITGKAVLKTVLFLGTGTYVNGTFSNSWEVITSGLNDQTDAEAGGNMYITSTASTNIATQNVPIKAACSTTGVNMFRVTSPANNRLTYSGSKTRSFNAVCSMSMTAATNNKIFTFNFAKNGTIMPESAQIVKMPSSQADMSVTLSCTVNMAPGDYIELWVTNNTDNTDITIESMNLAIQ